MFVKKTCHRKRNEGVRLSEPAQQSQVIIGECIQVLYTPPSPTVTPSATTTTTTTPSPPPSPRSRSPRKKAKTKEIKNSHSSPILVPTRSLRTKYIFSKEGNIDI